MGTSIVVGTDFSKLAKRALDLAAQLALRMGLPLHVVHAWNTAAWAPSLFSGEIPLEPILDSTRGRAEGFLEQQASECRALGCQVSAVLEEGTASRVLPQVAERERAKLLVVGRRGSANMNHVLLGSVSERVVRSSACPVLVVPAGDDPPAVPRRLLVGVDFSASSRDAVLVTVEIGEAMICEQPPVLTHAYRTERAEWLASWGETGRVLREKKSVDSLSRWARRFLPKSAAFDSRLIEGVAEDVLPAAAREYGCDWIVLGQQGRTALASFLLGSTTHHLLELTDRPVLVVPIASASEREPGD